MTPSHSLTTGQRYTLSWDGRREKMVSTKSHLTKKTLQAKKKREVRKVKNEQQLRLRWLKITWVRMNTLCSTFQRRCKKFSWKLFDTLGPILVSNSQPCISSHVLFIILLVAYIFSSLTRVGNKAQRKGGKKQDYRKCKQHEWKLLKIFG